MDKGVCGSPSGGSRLALLLKRVHLGSSVREGWEGVKLGGGALAG